MIALLELLFTWLPTLMAIFACYIAYVWLNPFPGGYKAPQRPPLPVGKERAFSGRSIQSVNPATGEKFWEENAATSEDVEDALARATVAQKEWQTSSFAERSALLYDLMQYIVDHQEEVCRWSVQDSGKTMMEAYYGEILTTCEKLRHLCVNGADALKPESRRPPLLLWFNKSARVEYFPVGNLGIIVPWNYPVHNVVSAVSSAVFAGNSAVVKVSEWSNGSRRHMDRMFREIVAKRGWNPDLIQLLPGYGDTGAALCRSKKVSKIFFIGSPETGKRVMQSCSENLTPVILELGGKDPMIILDDAEFDHAVDVALRGVFINQGQNCIAAERIYVQRKIYDRFCNVIQSKVSQMRQGPPIGRCVLHDGEQPVDCGAITMPAQLQIVDRLVKKGIEEGAKVLSGGRKPDQDALYPLFYPPTVLCDVRQDMEIVRTEAFGPIMLIIPFDSDEQVIEYANGTDYGLGCSIFSNNYSRAEAIGKQIASGMLTINDFGLSYLIQNLPFGGCKVSGFGRFNGPEGLREFSVIKSVVTDRFPVRTRAPRFTQYPIPIRAPLLVQNAVTLLYSGDLKKKVSSLFSFLSCLINLEKKFD